jgi:hypothetical protein
MDCFDASLLAMTAQDFEANIRPIALRAGGETLTGGKTK